MQLFIARIASLLFAVALAAGESRAQPAAAPDNFGLQDQAITVVGYTNFFPEHDVFGYSTENGARWADGGAGLEASLDMLPNGALVTQITAYGFDENPAVDLGVSLCRHWVDSATGANPGNDCPIHMSTDGTPGDTYLQDNTDVPILYRQDIDGDGTI